MEVTFTLARHFGTTPFYLFEQDTDTMIMIINHYIEKAGQRQNNTTTAIVNERDESAAFWAAL